MTGPRLSLRVIQDPVIRQSKPEMTILPMVEPGCGNGCGGCPRSIICNSPIKETGNELALSAAPTIVIETQSQKEFNLNAAQQALGFLDASPKDPTHFPLSAPIQVPFNVTAAQSITLAQNTGYCRGLYLFTLLMTDRLRELELYERSSPSDLSHPMPATPTEKPLQSTESELPLPKSERIVLEIPSLGVLDSALPFRAVTAQF
ncbi:hypothetical protein HY988_00260, partial [Candidatus Micrarchaeota archaeon]|nr:hypothetical protein [Candidatus Micrarchaeota archaeon]